MADLTLSLSLTQTSEQSPRVFVDASGSPLSLYLDVNPEILARPRLIRLLRSSGANICHSPSAASIILINSETESGLKFVHDWRADSHKTVLNYGWIQACLRTGRALIEADEWGGFRVLHTSGCAYSDDDADEGSGDVQGGTRLRPTPDKRAISSTPSPTFSSQASVSWTRPKRPSPTRPSSDPNVKPNSPSLANRPHASAGRTMSNSTPARSPSSALPFSVVMPSSPKFTSRMSTQTTSSPFHSTPVIPKHTISSFPSSQQSSAPLPCPLSQAGDTPTLAPSPSLAPTQTISQYFPLNTNHSGPQNSSDVGSVDLLHALNSAFQTQNTASQVQNVASQTLTQLVETVIAVAQGQGLDTSLFQSYLSTLPMSSSPIQHSPSHLQNPALLHSVDENLGTSVSDSPIGDVGNNFDSTYTPLTSQPSLPVKRKRKSPEPPRPAQRIPSSSRKNQSGVAVGPPQSGGGIFSAKSGRPILVFVQIDTRGRHEIVHLIKKNGGKITADIPDAAFVILNPRSVSYADLRQEADSSGRTIVQTSFIMESVKQGHLLNPNDFLLRDVSSPKKPSGGIRRPIREKHSPESDHATSEAQTSDTVVDASSSIPARETLRTPDPPPAVLSKSGYRFTPAEMTYTWALVRRILTKDRLATKMMVGKALQKKMPHHPMSSWLTQMSRHKEMYEAVRAEALRSFPPSDAHPPNSQPQQCTHHLWNDNDDVGMNVADRDTEELEELEVGGSLILDEDEAMRDGGDERHAYTRDLEALVEFLISEDADGGQEDELFERLTAKNTCMTAESWPDFLEQHADAVTEEVERRYKAQQAT